MGERVDLAPVEAPVGTESPTEEAGGGAPRIGALPDGTFLQDMGDGIYKRVKPTEIVDKEASKMSQKIGEAAFNKNLVHLDKRVNSRTR